MLAGRSGFLRAVKKSPHCCGLFALISYQNQLPTAMVTPSAATVSAATTEAEADARSATAIVARCVVSARRVAVAAVMRAVITVVHVVAMHPVVPMPPMLPTRTHVAGLSCVGCGFRRHRVVCRVCRGATEQCSCTDGKDDSELLHLTIP